MKLRYQDIPVDTKWKPSNLLRVEKIELVVLNLHPNVKIKDVKNVFNEMGDIKHVNLPLKKDTQEWLDFSNWKQLSDGERNRIPKPDRVPNIGTCFIIFKDPDSAVKALSICRHPSNVHLFGGLNVMWSKFSGVQCR